MNRNPGTIGLINLPKRGVSTFFDFLSWKIYGRDRETSKNVKKTLFGELSQSSRDSFELESDSKESWDDRLNTPKSGYSTFLDFLVSENLRTTNKKVQKCRIATFWRIKPNVPGFVRIRIGFERISGRVA